MLWRPRPYVGGLVRPRRNRKTSPRLFGARNQQAVFNSIFPIKDFNDTASLEFVGYVLEQPKYDVQECLQRGMTYEAKNYSLAGSKVGGLFLSDAYGSHSLLNVYIK